MLLDVHGIQAQLDPTQFLALEALALFDCFDAPQYALEADLDVALTLERGAQIARGFFDAAAEKN
jgi:hypothetical protein